MWVSGIWLLKLHLRWLILWISRNASQHLAYILRHLYITPLALLLQCFIYLTVTKKNSFWQEGGGEPPHGTLGWAIDTDFGSLEVLIQKMNAEGAALQGSGWVVSSVGASSFWTPWAHGVLEDITVQCLLVDCSFSLYNLRTVVGFG